MEYNNLPLERQRSEKILELYTNLAESEKCKIIEQILNKSSSKIQNKYSVSNREYSKIWFYLLLTAFSIITVYCSIMGYTKRNAYFQAIGWPWLAGGIIELITNLYFEKEKVRQGIFICFIIFGTFTLIKFAQLYDSNIWRDITYEFFFSMTASFLGAVWLLLMSEIYSSLPTTHAKHT